MTTTKRTARIFLDIEGYYICDESLNYLDTRGAAYQTKAAALRAAYQRGYTHVVGSVCYKPGLITSQIKVKPWEEQEHQRILRYNSES